MIATTHSFAEYIQITPPTIYEKPANFPFLRLLSVTADVTNTRSLAVHTFLVSTEV